MSSHTPEQHDDLDILGWGMLALGASLIMTGITNVNGRDVDLWIDLYVDFGVGAAFVVLGLVGVIAWGRFDRPVTSWASRVALVAAGVGLGLREASGALGVIAVVAAVVAGALAIVLLVLVRVRVRDRKTASAETGSA